MRLLSLSFVVSVFALVPACGAEVENDTIKGGGSPASDTSTSQGAPGTAGSPATETAKFCPAVDVTCAAARPVATAEELIVEVNKLAWQGVGLGKTSTLEIGEDLIADADLDVSATLLTAPVECTDDPAAMFQRCHAPLFRDYAFPAWSGPGLPGVTCAEVGDHPVRKGDTCSRITIAKGTIFRMRAVVEDMHPSAPTYWPFVEFAKPCSAPCADDEIRCGASRTCFTRGYASCTYCEGASPSTCACREGCTSKANGTECSYDTAPDTVAVGKCQSGSCNAK